MATSLRSTDGGVVGVRSTSLFIGRDYPAICIRLSNWQGACSEISPCSGYRGSFGIRSRAGSEFTERMLTVMATLRQPHDILDYVRTACEALPHYQLTPSLLPLMATIPGKGLMKAA